MAPKKDETLTLGKRLARLQEAGDDLSWGNVVLQNLEQLGRFKINWGKHTGETFQEALEGDFDWAKWVVEHLDTSEKPCHKAFIRFVELYVQEAEEVEKQLMTAQSSTPTEIPKNKKKLSASKFKPKSRSSPPKKEDVAASSKDSTDGQDMEQWEAVEPDETTVRVEELSIRMNHLETVLAQVAGAVQEIHQMQLQKQ